MIETKSVSISQILVRSSGYLKQICSHSLQPYRGCSFGNSLCGVGCYVQHNWFVTRGRTWGRFLEIRQNAAEIYLKTCRTERNWAYRSDIPFAIFCSSATDPFLPQERSCGITRSVLEAMKQQPPDSLIVQTRSPLVLSAADLLEELSQRCQLRVHMTIETDREQLPGLPPFATSVSARINACQELKKRGIKTIVTASPLLPIRDPQAFFQQIAEVADGVVIDHFIEGDGTPDGSRTRKTVLPEAMWEVEPDSITINYRDRIVGIARIVLPGRVGVGQTGFAGLLE